MDDVDAWLARLRNTAWLTDRPRLRCLVGIHRPSIEGTVSGRYIQRCACGAIGPAPWCRIYPFPWRRLLRRQPRQEATR